MRIYRVWAGLPVDRSARRSGAIVYEGLKIGTPAGRRPVGGPILRLSRSDSGRPRPGSPISGPEALLRNIGYTASGQKLSPSKAYGFIGFGAIDVTKPCGDIDVVKQYKFRWFGDMAPNHINP